MEILEQLKQAQELYPDSVEILGDAEAAITVQEGGARTRAILDFNDSKNVQLRFTQTCIPYETQEEIHRHIRENSFMDAMAMVVLLVSELQSAHSEVASGPCEEPEPQLQIEEKGKQSGSRRKPVQPVRYNHTNAPERFTRLVLRSTPTTVNKSTFISLTAEAHSMEEVDEFLDFVQQSKEFCDATHNMGVFRFIAPDGTVVEGCDEDGEDGAGVKMLFLMQKMKVVNRVAVCSRFWGGVLLGPVRFKLINESIQAVFEEAKRAGVLELEPKKK